MKALVILIGIVAAIVILFAVGLRIKPASFPAFAPAQPELKTIPLPSGLPAPVERFYRVTYGDGVPVIQSAVITGRGSMRLFGLPVPIRFRFAHEAGLSFRHDIDLTFFGRPVMKGYETFIDGRGWGKTPGGIDEGAGYDQGSNVSLWAEALNWFPAILVTDPRVRWEPVDNATALLSVPFGTAREIFVVRFEPENGLVQCVEAMKYKTATKRKTLWINGSWSDEGKPWIQLNAEKVELNVDVKDYMRAERP